MIPGSGRSPGEGNGNPLQYSCLKNPLDRGTWWVAKSCVQLKTINLATIPTPRIQSKGQTPTSQHPWALQVALVIKNLPANAGDARDLGSIPGPRSSPGVGNGNPLQYSCLGNSMDIGAWWAAVLGITKS